MNYCSNPSELRITDMRFVDIDGAPKRCTILRIDTNQGISGFGEGIHAERASFGEDERSLAAEKRPYTFCALTNRPVLRIIFGK